MKKLLILLSFLALTASPAWTQNDIHLKDGSVLKGKVVSMSGGVYKVQTENIGLVEVKENNVKMISDGSAAALGQLDAGVSKESIQAYSQQMQGLIFSDPALMESINSLSQNESIMQLIQDPTVMQDLMSMDPATIQNNPAIQKILNDPQMKALMQQVEQKVTPPNSIK